MPHVREVYEMVTKQKPPEPGALERQQKRQVRAARNKKFGAFAVAAVIGVAAVALLLTMRPSGEEATPADEPSALTAPDPAAVGIAEDYFKAVNAFDAEQAMSYLSDDAIENRKSFRQSLSWLEATGFEKILDFCQQVGSSTASGTLVSCTYDFHGLRSDEMGLGPYSGSSDEFTVHDGQIVRESGLLDTEKFSPQVWEPFAEWVSKAYPQDAAVMYADETYSLQMHTPESIRLWEQHTREYVKEVQRANG
jgi:hypothetical protein